MILARYRHRLPADYDLGLIRARIMARGPTWDAAPGLIFKAFTLEDRSRGASENAYSSFYLWRDAGAAAAFFAGPGFAAVMQAFGRPRTDLWLPFDVQTGPLPEPAASPSPTGPFRRRPISTPSVARTPRGASPSAPSPTSWLCCAGSIPRRGA